MAISFEGMAERYVTFTADETAKEGQVCKVTANGTVGACAASDAFCGVVSHVRNGAAAVLLQGYVELPYTGSAPTLGYCALVADSAGGVATGDGEKRLVVSVDQTAQTVGVFL